MYNYPYYRTMRNPDVVAYSQGDVNGDRIPDHVYLTGTKIPDGALIQNITLVIQNGATGAHVNIPLKNNVGYDPTIFLGDFTGDGVADILISIPTGGSGGTSYYYIYSFVNNMAHLLFDSDVFNQHYKYDVTYKDYYRVEVDSKTNNMKYMIDLSLRDSDYLNEIYDTNGKLKNPISGWVDPLSGLYPVDFDYDRVLELLTYQQIAGRYHADTVGYVQDRLKWNGHTFALTLQNVAIFGKQG